MDIPGLSRETIESHADGGSIRRGREYFEDAAVKSLRRKSEDEVEAYVQGSDIAPYHVQIRHDSEGITSAECTCPYVGGSWCRHIVAALFAALESHGDADGSLSEMLDGYDRIELIHLIERMAETYPGITELVASARKRHA